MNVKTGSISRKYCYSELVKLKGTKQSSQTQNKKCSWLFLSDHYFSMRQARQGKQISSKKNAKT